MNRSHFVPSEIVNVRKLLGVACWVVGRPLYFLLRWSFIFTLTANQCEMQLAATFIDAMILRLLLSIGVFRKFLINKTGTKCVFELHRFGFLNLRFAKFAEQQDL